MRSRRLRPVILALAVCGAVALIGPTGAFAAAETTVTIKEDAPGDFKGKVKSKKPKCVDGREVKLFKDRKNKPDKYIASDNAEADGKWSTGNTGLKGRYYAKAPAIEGCKKGRSETIKSTK